MAITGYAIIRPSSEDFPTPHSIHDLTVNAPAQQDGVWSTGGEGTNVSNVKVWGGGGGIDNYQFRVGTKGGT